MRIRSGPTSQILSNFLSLSVLQAANYVLPLLTLPYLIRVLGAEKFGLLAFATAITSYFSILTDYGFNLSATRDIAIHRNNNADINRIFSSVMTLKIGFLIVSAGLMALIVFLSPKFSQHWQAFVLTFGAVIGQALFPVWLFQGLEQMKYVTYLNIGAKLAFTVLVFVFVHDDQAYLFVPALTSAGSIIAGVWSLQIARKRFNIQFYRQERSALVVELKKGWHVFIATSFSSLYRESNTVILGFLTSPVIVGYYAIAEKIVKAIQGAQTPLGQALFPYLARRSGQHLLRGFVLRHWMKATFIYGVACFVVMASSSFIVRHLAALSFQYVLFDFRVLSIIVFIGGLNFYFGVLGLLSAGKNGEFSRAVGVAGFSNIFLCFILSYFLGHHGAAFAVVISEAVLLLLVVKSVLRLSQSEQLNEAT